MTRAKAVASRYKTRLYKNYDKLLSDVEAVVIAAPAKFHGEMALRALRANCHTLIEKPIAASLAEAQQIVSVAQQKDLTVQVGHQERFVIKAIGLDKVPEKPIRITGHRRNSYSLRGTDVSATLDLMTHDIDLVIWLMGESPVNISGESIVIRSGQPDAAFCHMIFSDDRRALIEASRVEEVGSRMMTITYPSGDVNIDFNAKTLNHDTSFDLDANFSENPIARDSLGAATNAFVEALLDGKPVPVTGGHGLRALRTALEIDGEV